MSKKSVKLITRLFIFGIAGSSAYAACNISQLDSLFKSIANRNGYMQAVAANKYAAHKNIYDADQELKVLKTSQQIGHQNNLPVSQIMLYTQIQMDLAKQIEAHWFNYWEINPDKRPDSKSVQNLESLRTQIRDVDSKLYPQIAANLSNLANCSESITIQHFNQAFSDIQGIPHNPEFSRLMLGALYSISHNKVNK